LKKITLIERFKFEKGGFEPCLDLHKKTRKSIGVGTKKKCLKLESVSSISQP
jgi:hypothetical protein